MFFPIKVRLDLTLDATVLVVVVVVYSLVHNMPYVPTLVINVGRRADNQTKRVKNSTR